MPNANPTSERIGEAVRAERKRQGLDQRTLALVANVGERSIYRIENGEQTVRLDVLLRVLLLSAYSWTSSRASAS